MRLEKKLDEGERGHKQTTLRTAARETTVQVVRVEGRRLGGETNDLVIDGMWRDGEGGPQGTYNLTGKLGALEKNWEAAGGGGESSEGSRKVRWAWIQRHEVGRFLRGRNLPPQRGEARGQSRGARVSVDDL